MWNSHAFQPADHSRDEIENLIIQNKQLPSHGCAKRNRRELENRILQLRTYTRST
jgi:hypothetical protein